MVGLANVLALSRATRTKKRSGSTPSVVLPSPSFGSSNLVAWHDVTKTWTDALGSTQPAVFYDTVGYNTVSALIDLSGNGNGWIQPDKSLQPNKGTSGPLFDSGTVQSFMNCQNASMLAGLSQFSVYIYARPIAGTSKRTALYIAEATSTVAPTAAAVASGGSFVPYVVGEQVTLAGGTFTTAAVIRVDAVGPAGVTAASVVNPGSYTVKPSNPVSQASTTGSGTGLTVSLTFGSGPPYSVTAVSSPSSPHYQVGDYNTLTGGSIVQVSSIDGSGFITGVNIAVPTSTASPPANPVSQTATSNPAGTAVGTGATFNLTYPPVGGGTTTERFAIYFAAGSTSRKRYITTSALDGAQNSTSTSNGTSWGAANNGVLTDTTTYHAMGVEVDYTGASAVANFYYDSGSLDGASQTWTPVESAPWALNSTPSSMLRLGNNSTPNAALQGEIKAMVFLSEIPSSARRTQILNYFAGLP